ncbi:hypothetical protein QYE76_036671 [Lolium multiflorum]|uniref:NB-ARC domain-containing protein n=1 Tax=Lolium multiflorum TaxID=4521 RepID=A0AAD8R1F3_LOLMU|nr:hypothetical protein QYE76_036671 [Lolium multiflorum]
MPSPRKKKVKECPKFHSLNVLKESLEEKLREKRVLLVLDDVWYNISNSEGREELQKLVSPLHVGKAGSRILVTSRTEAALVTLGAEKERCIPISELDDEVFLEMFKHYALRDARVGDNDRRILEMIAEDIAKKLKRSPLAARTVGSRLRERQTVEFWRSEKDRDLLSDTMGALRWSYQYLDEQVKRCFAYCSIFPRGHHLKRDELVKLWVAEGFINTSGPEQEMEDVAKVYFDELLSASFLELGGKEVSSLIDGDLRDVYYFTIHDLMCDLAEEVAGKDSFRIEKDFTGEVPQDVRYIFVGTYNSKMLTEKISGLKNLRTLIIHPSIQLNSTEWQAFERMFDMLMGLQKLRVLKLGFNGNDLNEYVFVLKDSIGRLTHLRYFAFRMNQRMKLTVPGNFTELYHMQVVDFGDYTELVFSNNSEDMFFRETNEDMMNLINLRCAIPQAIMRFPNVGGLAWLQMLVPFFLRKEQGYELHQLKHLNKLQELGIFGLDDIQSKEEALDANLAGKEKLTKLDLVWVSESCSPEVQAEVLEGLCPSKYLEKLSIDGYHGVKLPKWMMSEHNGGPKNLKELKLESWREPDLALVVLRAFTHLHLLHLRKCSWDALPDMEHLTSLKELGIFDCMNMRLLGTLPKSLDMFIVCHCKPEFERLCIHYWSRLHQRLYTPWKVHI